MAQALTETLIAPAKLTRSLRILGLREDGFHDIEAEMVSLDLFDQLTFEREGPTGVTVVDGIETDLGNDNLVTRALGATGSSAHVRLIKRIPVGGGLGGGSSDAAAVLRWAGTDDLELAARLGADVPFCVVGGRAKVEGIGERVTPLEFESLSFVLVLPPFAVSTAAVYGSWDHLAERVGNLQDDSPNELTAAAVLIEPRLAGWGGWLSEASGRQATLAGSGSTWFVEGTLEGLGIDPELVPSVEGQAGRLLEVHTVPAGWAGPGEAA